MMRSTNLFLTAGVIALLAASPVLAGQAADPHGGGHAAPKHGQHMGELDINSASAEELRQLPGINEAAARRIVENRPYTRPDELTTKKVLSKTTYDSIRAHIMARPGATKPAAK